MQNQSQTMPPSPTTAKSADSGPSRQALLACYAEIERILRERGGSLAEAKRGEPERSRAEHGLAKPSRAQQSKEHSPLMAPQG